jgi:hypothetical protein
LFELGKRARVPGIDINPGEKTSKRGPGRCA